jgi:hypothetical protein
MEKTKAANFLIKIYQLLSYKPLLLSFNIITYMPNSIYLPEDRQYTQSANYISDLIQCNPEIKTIEVWDKVLYARMHKGSGYRNTFVSKRGLTFQFKYYDYMSSFFVEDIERAERNYKDQDQKNIGYIMNIISIYADAISFSQTIHDVEECGQLTDAQNSFIDAYYHHLGKARPLRPKRIPVYSQCDQIADPTPPSWLLQEEDVDHEFPF